MDSYSVIIWMSPLVSEGARLFFQFDDFNISWCIFQANSDDFDETPIGRLIGS